MFFSSQTRSTAIADSLNTTWANSPVFPGVSTDNSLGANDPMLQPTGMSGASQSLPARTPIVTSEPVGVTRAPFSDGQPIVVTRAPFSDAQPIVVTRAPFSGSSSAPITLALTPDPGDTPNRAFDLGYIRADSPKTVSDSVSTIDTDDFYRFTVDRDSNLTLRLSGLSADADVAIIRDGNFNGVVDPGEIIIRSQNGGSSEESIDLRGLVGSYYVRVYSYNNANNTNYTLSLSANGGAFGTAPEPNNSLAQAYDIGTLNGNRNFSGFVSSTSDQHDFYRFNLGTTSNFKLVLNGLSQDADVELIRDSNGNGLVDPGEVIRQSTAGGASRESIDFPALAGGDYFVRVLAYGSSNATNYNLYLLGQPV